MGREGKGVKRGEGGGGKLLIWPREVLSHSPITSQGKRHPGALGSTGKKGCLWLLADPRLGKTWLDLLGQECFQKTTPCSLVHQRPTPWEARVGSTWSKMGPLSAGV